MQIAKNILAQRILFVTYWVALVFPLFDIELIPALNVLRPYVFISADLSLIILYLWLVRSWRDHLVTLSFILISWFSTCVLNGYGISFWFNGTREFFGLFLMCPLFRYFLDEEHRREPFIKSLDKQLEVLLVIQSVVVVYQFFKYGAGDNVGGTYGALSATLSMTLYLTSYYLMHKHLDPKRFFKSLWDNKRYLIFLIPTFLNETKISFLLLALYFLLLLPVDRKVFIRSLAIVPLLVVVVGGGYFLYKFTTFDRKGTELNEEALTEYLFQEMNFDEAKGDSEWNMKQASSQNIADLPRFTKLLLLPEVEEDSPGHWTWGFGVGHFKGGQVMEISDFAQEYDWYLVGTNMFFLSMMIQLGIVGCVWFVFAILNIYARPPREATGVHLNMLLYSISMTLIILFYSDLWRTMPFSFLFFLFPLLAAKYGDENKVPVETDDNEV